jgi:hypothetical protein
MGVKGKGRRVFPVKLCNKVVYLLITNAKDCQQKGRVENAECHLLPINAQQREHKAGEKRSLDIYPKPAAIKHSTNRGHPISIC